MELHCKMSENCRLLATVFLNLCYNNGKVGLKIREKVNYLRTFFITANFCDCCEAIHIKT